MEYRRTYSTLIAAAVLVGLIGFIRTKIPSRTSTEPAPTPSMSGKGGGAEVGIAFVGRPDGDVGPDKPIVMKIEPKPALPPPPVRLQISDGEFASLVKNGYIPPSDRVEAVPSREHFYINKVVQGPFYDVVLAGDSRVMRSAAPHLIQEGLPGKRIYNFAFGGVAWTREYMDAIERLLNPGSREKIIVVGPTPPAFTQVSAESNWFVRAIKVDRLARYQFLKANTTVEAFRPIGEEQEADGAGLQTFYANGWYAFTAPPELTVFKKLKKKHKNRPMDMKMMDSFFERVAEWTKKGIKVYGYRPPSLLLVEMAEDKVLNFDAADFRRRFEAAGGRWIEFDRTRYNYNDGHHMNEASAHRFSADLADILAGRVESHASVDSDGIQAR